VLGAAAETVVQAAAAVTAAENGAAGVHAGADWLRPCWHLDSDLKQQQQQQQRQQQQHRQQQWAVGGGNNALCSRSAFEEVDIGCAADAASTAALHNKHVCTLPEASEASGAAAAAAALGGGAAWEPSATVLQSAPSVDCSAASLPGCWVLD
jgi:hypothetical protein